MADKKNLVSYDNQIRMKNKASDTDSEYELFGASQVFVGVENPNEQEIVKDDNGFNYARNKVEGIEIHNIHTKSHRCWLMIDLETGGRGWYPGSKEVVDVSNALVYKEPDDESEVITQINENITLDKLDLVYGKSIETTKKIIYCKVKLNNDHPEAYIKNSQILATRFVDDL